MKVRTLLVALALAAGGVLVAAPAQAAPPVTGVSAAAVEAAKADMLAKALKPSAVTKVIDHGNQVFEVQTTTLAVLSAKLSRTGSAEMAAAQVPPWYGPHAAIGYCFGFHFGDAGMYLNQQNVALLRTFFTGVYNYSTGQNLPANEQNKKCAATVQTGPFWGYGGWTLSSKLVYQGTQITAGPNYASNYYARTWGIVDDRGACAYAHGAVSIPGYGYYATFRSMHC